MTSLDENSFHVHSIGGQAQSQRKSQPLYSLSKVGRDQRQKTFISHEHSKSDSLGRQSPIGGAIYNLPSTLNLKTGVAFTKGGGAGSAFLNVKGDPDECDSIYELNILVDSQQFKYGRDSTMLIGTEPRGRLKDAELIKNHSAAFFGRESPGPAAIGEAGGPRFEITKKRMGYATPFAKKLDHGSMFHCMNSQPENIGPGLYPRKDIAVGQQFLSNRKNQPCNAFGQGPKFPKPRNADSISLLDAAKSSLGKQGLSKNRSAPSVGFVAGTRDQRSRTAICITKDDMGPKAFMAKPHMSMPRLPMERDIMEAGWRGVAIG
jgi:hypothetical protein